jgi:ribosomal protein S18 acetylase RimI-like enzyme
MPESLSERCAVPALTLRHATADDFGTVRRHYGLVQDAHAANMPDTFRRMDDKDFPVERFSAFLTDDNLLLIAEHQGKAVGSVLASCYAADAQAGFLPGRNVFVWYVVTEPDMRGRGIATAMIGATAEWAAAKEAYCINLAVWRFNASAFALYRKLGFDESNVGLRIDPAAMLGRWGRGRLPKLPPPRPRPERARSRLLSWLFRR